MTPAAGAGPTLLAVRRISCGRRLSSRSRRKITVFPPDKGRASPRFPRKARRANINTDRGPIVALKVGIEAQLGPVSWGGLR